MLLLNYPLDTEKEEVERKRKKKEKRKKKKPFVQCTRNASSMCTFFVGTCVLLAGLHPIRQMACIFMQHGGLAVLFLQ